MCFFLYDVWTGGVGVRVTVHSIWQRGSDRDCCVSECWTEQDGGHVDGQMWMGEVADYIDVAAIAGGLGFGFENSLDGDGARR